MTTPRSTGRPGSPQQQVIDRASTDAEFRTRLLENPRDAVSEELGISLPESIIIRVIEEQPGEVVLVLPAQTTASGAQLSEADLEAVAGGGVFDGTWGPLGCTANCP